MCSCVINISFCTVLYIMIRIFDIFNKIDVTKIFTKIRFLNFSAHVPLSFSKACYSNYFISSPTFCRISVGMKMLVSLKVE